MDRVFLRSQYAVYYRHARRAKFSSQARSDYTALFLLKGRLRCSVAGLELELGEAGAMLVDAGASGVALGRGETETLTLTLAPGYLLDSAMRMRLSFAGTRVVFRESIVERDEQLERLARDLADELGQEQAGHELIITALVEQVVVHLLRRHANVRRSDELELSRVGLVDRRIRRAVELMHANLDRDLPLEELAAAAYISPFHFSRLFKKLTGTSPHAYLATLRVERAQTLLAETDLNVSEVSARVGFNSPSHFSKAFRQSTGMTPRAFRSAIVR